MINIPEEKNDDRQVDLGQFKGHQRKFPWTLLIKVVIVIVFLFLLYYATDLFGSRQLENTAPDVELEIERPEH